MSKDKQKATALSSTKASVRRNGKLKTYLVTGYTTIEVRTIVQARSEDEAIKEATDREVSICVHGTEDSYADDDWVYVDAPDMVEPNLAKEYDEEYSA